MGQAILRCRLPVIFLKPISPRMASVFKDVRLRALKEMPLAFSSTYAKESDFPEAEWVRRSERWRGDEAILYLAFDNQDEKAACGMVACYADEEGNAARGHVISMWVDPKYRRAGVGKLLIEGLKDWARMRRLRGLKLMVTSVNQGAIDFYERMGFVMSGITGPYENDPAVFEHEMVWALEE